LRYALANLRRVIGDHTATPPFLQVSRQEIQFDLSSDAWIDVTAFVDLAEPQLAPLATVQPTDDETIRRLEEAVELYRGEFLEGFSIPDSPAFEEWTLLQRESLHRLITEALHRLADTYRERGELERALKHAWRQVELDPWREQAHRQVMWLMALSGQRSAALAQYETCRHLLAEELGVEPAQETTALYEQIRDGEVGSVEVQEAPSLPYAPTPQHNLPAPITPFVGREKELAELKDRLADPACRLLSLVGPGGSGKTRLAVEAAVARVDRFAHGACFVSLAPVQSIDTIVPTVAQALGFRFSPTTEGGAEAALEQQLLEYLRPRNILLILDNFEHLLEGAGIVTDILETAPDVKTLVTSRARLNVRGEYLFTVLGMAYPALTPGPEAGSQEPREFAQYSAIRLFLQGARQARPDFEPTADDLAEIAHICHLVQGMPLGILLAAAWMEVLTPAAISAEIEESLDFLDTDWRDVPERQRSLRAVFDYSWALLTEREREVFQGLSVFRGGFTRQAAEQVAAASLRDLKALVGKSFLQQGAAVGRYEVHELLRQYAAEKLATSPAARLAAHERHSATYTAALHHWDADLKGRRQREALDEIAADSENVRAAWDWAVEHEQVERLDQAMDGLASFYWQRRRYQEGEAAFRAAADGLAAAASLAPSGDGPAPSPVAGLRVSARALSWQSYFSRALGRRELAAQLQRQSLALLERPELADQDTRAERALLFYHMGHTVLMSDYERARQLFERSLALYRKLDDRWGVACQLDWLGSVAHFQGAYGDARRLYEESLAIFQALGDQEAAAWDTGDLAYVAMDQGRFEEAERLGRESRAKAQEFGTQELIAYGWLVVGETLQPLARFAEACSALEECLAIFEDLGRRGWMTSAHAVLSSVNLHLGQYGRARAHAETGLALARETGLRFRTGHTLLLLGSVALAEESYAEAQRLLEESVAVYRETENPDDIARALAVSAYAARGLGQVAQARAHVASALRTVIEIQGPMPLLYGLPALALLLADEGEGERAAEVYAIASRYPLVAQSRWFEDVVGSHIAAVVASLPLDVLAAARDRGQARDPEAAVPELLAELGRVEEADDG
jgi:predicted ATPase/DNA-binding SARP family transcriptional activator